MSLGKYGALAKKYLKEYKPIKYNELIINGTIMDYLYDVETHLKGYADLIELELKEQYPAPNEKENFIEQVKYINMIQGLVDEYVKEEIKSI